MLKLEISIKRELSRIHDPDAESKNMLYVSVRKEMLLRDRWTCQGCGMVSKGNVKADPSSYEFSGFLEGHHINDNHGDNSIGNLATVCPFCHEIFHAGISGKQNRCIPIVLPDMTHVSLNRLCHVLFCVIERAQSSSDVMYARRLYDGLMDRNRLLPESLQMQSNLGSALASLKRDQYKNREVLLQGIRLLPLREAYSRHVNWYISNSWDSIGADWKSYKESILNVK